MNYWMLLPPVAFFVIFIFMALQLWSFGTISPKGQSSPGKGKAYACGESSYNHRVQPDYAQFFPFAFFFTIMHVVVLIVATVPIKAPTSVLLAGAYLVAAAVGLFILFRR